MGWSASRRSRSIRVLLVMVVNGVEREEAAGAACTPLVPPAGHPRIQWALPVKGAKTRQEARVERHWLREPESNRRPGGMNPGCYRCTIPRLQSTYSSSGRDLVRGVGGFFATAKGGPGVGSGRRPAWMRHSSRNPTLGSLEQPECRDRFSGKRAGATFRQDGSRNTRRR